MNAVRDGIITFNEEGEILLVNREMEKMWGFQTDMLVGKPFTFLIPPPHKSLQLELFKRRIKNEKSHIFTGELIMTGQRADGDIFPIELHISDFEYEGKRIFTAVVRDITERLQVEKDLRDSKLQLELRTRELEKTQEELNQLVEELKRSNSELEQFAYNASHDLQEPLRNVEGYISLLKRQWEKASEETIEEYLGHAEKGVVRMQALIHDLLHYSRAGRDSTPFIEISTELIIEMAKNNLRLPIQQSQAIITTENLPPVIKGARLQLIQLFQNILSNAIKFTPHYQQPNILIKYTKKENHHRFEITDNGIGIAEKDIERIFVNFQRLHPYEAYPGTGLGLAICKKNYRAPPGHYRRFFRIGKRKHFLFYTTGVVKSITLPGPIHRSCLGGFVSEITRLRLP